MQYEEVKKDGGLAEVPPLPEDKYQLDNTPTIKVIKQKKNFFDVIKNMSTGIRKSIKTWRTLSSARRASANKKNEEKKDNTKLWRQYLNFCHTEVSQHTFCHC